MEWGKGGQSPQTQNGKMAGLGAPEEMAAKKGTSSVSRAHWALHPQPRGRRSLGVPARQPLQD